MSAPWVSCSVNNGPIATVNYGYGLLNAKKCEQKKKKKTQKEL